jgi:hypothetical protein
MNSVPVLVFGLELKLKRLKKCVLRGLLHVRVPVVFPTFVLDSTIGSSGYSKWMKDSRILPENCATNRWLAVKHLSVP